MPIKPNITSFNSGRDYFESYGLTCVYWQPSSMQRPDYHNEVELNFLKSGSVTYLYGGRKETVEAGNLAVFWAAIPHQVIDFSTDVVYFAATIPLQSFLQWRMPENFLQALMQGQFLREADHDMTGSDAALFERWERDLCSAREELEKPVSLEIQARLTRMALTLFKPGDAGVKTGDSQEVTDSGLSKVEQMACFIMKNYTEKVTIHQISDFVGLTPNYAMNLFRRTFGSTLVDYLTQHRISHAQRLLMTTNLPITQIALESGFTSISRFNEAFSRTCGCSPRQYGRNHKA